jgi:PAS domain S-box-containing protein
MRLTEGEELEYMIDTAPIGICLLNAETLVAELVNDKFIEVAGKPYEAIHGRYYWDAFTEAKADYEQKLLGVVETGNAFFANEVELMLIRHGEKENIFVTFAYAPVKNKEGKITKIAVWALENTKQVTERKVETAAKVLFQQERDRLRSYFMQAATGICVLYGPDLIYELVNPAYQGILPGRSLLGRPIFEALPELKGTGIQTAMLNVYRTGEPYEMTNLLIPVAEYEGGPTLDRYFTFSFQPLRNETNDIVGIVNFAFEVTAMMRAQQGLDKAREESDQLKRVYETITSGTPDLMYVWDLDYRFTYVNNALLTMWGKTWDTAIGKGLRENGYEEWHAAMHEREIDQVVATKKSIRGEVAFPHAVLGQRIYDYILIPVFNETGQVVAVAGTTRDVTERKQMEQQLADSSEELQAINEEMVAANEEQTASNEELMATNQELALVNEELKQARQKIEESEIAMRLAISAANFGTWFIHSETREFKTDARLKELFGYYPDESLSIEQALAQITDEYRGLVSKKLENAIYNGGDYDVTYPVIGLHDNRLRWLRAIGNLKADPSGTFSAFTGVVMDVTEQLLDEQRKNDFIGMVSHELKTPLTSLTAIVQVANGKLKSSEDKFLSGAMEKANTQVKRMSNMINGFLNVSRLESSKLYIDKSDFDLWQVVEDVVREAELTATTHHIQLHNCGRIQINADHEKITSVISNLISNAVKYSSKGTNIEVKCETMNNKVYFSVKDEGIGLTPEDRNKVFDRYFRAQNINSNHISGFGIGLYLSAEIIRRHNGEIGVESEPGNGSKFWFTLGL